MPIPRNHRDLFRIPRTTDKLIFLKSLVQAQDLTAELALALINIIRAELERPQLQSAAAYRCYTQVSAFLCKQMPKVYEETVKAWQQRRLA